MRPERTPRFPRHAACPAGRTDRAVERGRLVEVWASRRRGSGYLVADRLVLTAAHVLRGEGGGFEDRLEIRFLQGSSEGAPPLTARPAWVRYDGPDAGVDAALVEITAPAWTPPPGLRPVVWGRLDGDEPGLRVQLAGFPEALSTQEDTDADQVAAVVNPLSGLRSGRLQLLTESAPERSVGGPSLWSGVSGGPVCGRRTEATAGTVLLGVVVVDPVKHPGRLTAVPVTAVLEDEAAAAVLRSHRVERRSVAYSCRSHAMELRTTPAAVMRTLPRDLASFVGRSHELARLTSAVLASSESSPVIDIHAIGGMPGVGKTALAVHAGHRLAERFPDGQLFLPLHGHTPGQSPVEPSDALASLLAASGVAQELIPNGADPLATLDARTAMWRDRLAGKRVLLILDDAVDHDQVEPLLPNAAECLVLITSRRRLVALPDAVVLALDTLTRTDAVAMLCRLSRRTPEGADEVAAAHEVVTLCGQLPLAVGLIAGRLRNHPSWSFSHLARSLSATRRRLARLQAGNIAVAAAFELSYRDLDTDRQRFFRLLSLHPGSEYSAETAAALHDLDPVEAGDLLEALYDEHLVVESAPGRYRMHDLMREFAGTLTEGDPEPSRAAALERLFDHYEDRAAAAASVVVSGTLPSGASADRADRSEAMAWLDSETANLLACARYCSDHAQAVRVVALARSLAGFLRLVGPWEQAVALHRTAADCAAAIGDRPGRAVALGNLALVRRLTGDYESAVQDLSQAMELHRALGDRKSEARALNDLGAVYGQTGDYPATADAHQRALAISRELEDVAGAAGALNYLGVVQRLRGDYSAAEPALRESTELFQTVGDQRGRATALNNLGVVLRQTGRYAEAEACMRQALDAAREVGDRRGAVYIRNALGVVRQLAGDLAEAERLQTEALESARELRDRRGQVYSLNYLGAVLRSTGNWAEAAEAHEEALETARVLGDRRAQGHALHHLAFVRMALGDTRAAEVAAEEALDIATALGDRRGRAGALRAGGLVQAREGRAEAAVRSLSAAHDLCEDIGDRQGRAALLNDLGEVRLAQADTLAEDLHREAAELAHALGSPLEEARALAGLGRCAHTRGESDLAMGLLQRAMTLFVRIGAAERQELAAEFPTLYRER
ncbi:tetratricopeptide repeat protein [Streptomyces virginiae]|uniref:tetratricopeptide repeat protein n=1 Tax=Streptomyces virginiae TaxID=1961 RepID=UPI00362996FA